MRLLDIAVNAIIVVSVTVFLAYVGVQHFDHGLFVTLPEDITTCFTSNGALQHVALGLLVAAMLAKIPVGRAIARDDARKRT